MTFAQREAQWAAWLRAAMAGDAAAYRQFLDAITPHLRAMAHRHAGALGGSREDIEDVVQEVLLAVHLKRGTWDTSRPVGPWLSAIVRNKLVDVLRQKGRRPTIPIEDVADALAVPEAHDHLQAYDIDRMIGGLKGVQRDIVQSISMNGSSIRDTAGRLNMTEGAVRVALHRALRALAAAYRGTT